MLDVGCLMLLNSGLIGMWKDRTDITDSVEYAHQFREQAMELVQGCSNKSELREYNRQRSW
ncbi:MAG TPA: hypothetical protein ENK58_03440 [Desulfobacterales bacterium]|nr:hypothetical protein [Desulfobacterales bacterium]